MTKEDMINIILDDILNTLIECPYCHSKAQHNDDKMEDIMHKCNCPWLLAKQLKEMED